MTTPMIIALGITLFMIYLIMTDKLPFGAPPLLACVLIVIFGLGDVKAAFAGFTNSSVIMVASFMPIMTAIQKTSLLGKLKDLMITMAEKGGYKSYVFLVVLIMLGTCLFGTGSTAYYVLILSLLSTMPYSKNLPVSKLMLPLGFATNHPLIPLNVAMHFGIMVSLLETAGVATGNIPVVKFSVANLFLSIGYLVWCLVSYKLLPDHEIAAASEDAKAKAAVAADMPKWKENLTYAAFAMAVLGMIFQSKIGNAGYVVPGLAAAILVFADVINFKEVRDGIGAPVILMMAGVIGVADALGNTGFTAMIGESVAGALGGSINPFILVFAFCVLTSTLATFTGSSLGTVYVFAPIAIAVCVSLGLNPTAAAAAITVSGWNGGYMPIDGMPAMIMGMGNYKLSEFWKFTVPMYFIRLLALTVGCVVMFPM